MVTVSASPAAKGPMVVSAGAASAHVASMCAAEGTTPSAARWKALMGNSTVVMAPPGRTSDAKAKTRLSQGEGRVGRAGKRAGRKRVRVRRWLEVGSWKRARKTLGTMSLELSISVERVAGVCGEGTIEGSPMRQRAE